MSSSIRACTRSYRCIARIDLVRFSSGIDALRRGGRSRSRPLGDEDRSQEQQGQRQDHQDRSDGKERLEEILKKGTPSADAVETIELSDLRRIRSSKAPSPLDDLSAG
jgi:hypothetical protein